MLAEGKGEGATGVSGRLAKGKRGGEKSEFEKSKNLRKKEKKAPYPPPPSYPMLAVMKSKRPSRFKTQVNIDPSNVSSPLTCILYRWHPLSRLDPNAIFSMDKEVDKERQRQQPR